MIGADLCPTVLFDQLDEFLLEFEEHDKEISSGVMVVGDAADYALIWEWGNTRQTKQGPRTVLGPNPSGKIVWMSSQAPEGWIRTNEDQFWTAFEQELQKASFDQPDARAMTKELEKRAVAAAERVADILREKAPKDSSLLSESLVVVEPGRAILDTEEDDFGPLTMIGDEV